MSARYETVDASGACLRRSDNLLDMAEWHRQNAHYSAAVVRVEGDARTPLDESEIDTVLTKTCLGCGAKVVTYNAYGLGWRSDDPLDFRETKVRCPACVSSRGAR